MTDDQLQGVISQIWHGHSDRYSELRVTLAPGATPQVGRRMEHQALVATPLP